MVYVQTWRAKVTPAGTARWAHTARGPITSEPVYSGWPTPNTPSGGPNTKSTAKHTGGMDLDGAVLMLSGWPTPQAAQGPNMSENRGTDHGGSRGRQTPQSVEGIMAQLAGWTTASATDARRAGTGITEGMSGSSLPQMSKLATGTIPDGSSAATESTAGFQLNPRFSLWLMGYPTSWHDAGVRALRSLREPATPSCRKPRPSLSKPSNPAAPE